VDNLIDDERKTVSLIDEIWGLLVLDTRSLFLMFQCPKDPSSLCAPEGLVSDIFNIPCGWVCMCFV